MEPVLLCITILCIQRTQSASAGQLELQSINQNSCPGTKQNCLAGCASNARSRRSTCISAVLPLSFHDVSAGGLPGREPALVQGPSSDWACQLLLQQVCVVQWRADALKGHATCAKVAL